MKRLIKDIKRYHNYTKYVAKAFLVSDVNTSYLNRLWWGLEPLLKMLVYLIIFGYVFKASEENFECFIFIGVILWDYFNGTISKSIGLIIANKQIVTKVYVPKPVLLVCEMYKNTYRFLFGFCIELLMIIIRGIGLSWTMLLIIPLYFLLSLLIFGISLINMHYGVYVNDLSHAITSIMRFLMFFSGIFYSIEKRFPPAVGQWIVKLNPVAFYISAFRGALLYKTLPSWQWLLLWTFVSLVLIKIGANLLYKYESNYAKVI